MRTKKDMLVDWIGSTADELETTRCNDLIFSEQIDVVDELPLSLQFKFRSAVAMLEVATATLKAVSSEIDERNEA